MRNKQFSTLVERVPTWAALSRNPHQVNAETTKEHSRAQCIISNTKACYERYRVRVPLKAGFVEIKPQYNMYLVTLPLASPLAMSYCTIPSPPAALARS